jgi:CheY-like chemotaxis protein
MDGYEIARRLRSEPGLTDVLLIALTGYGRDEDRRRCREVGFDHHLVKPVDPDALQRLFADSGAATRPGGRPGSKSVANGSLQ